MPRETSSKLLQGVLNITRVSLLEISVSGNSIWIAQKHRIRRIMDFKPEICKLAGIWRLRKEFPKPCKLKFFSLPVVDAQRREESAVINPRGQFVNRGDDKC